MGLIEGQGQRGLSARSSPSVRSLEYWRVFLMFLCHKLLPSICQVLPLEGVRPQGKGSTVVPEAVASVVEGTLSSLSYYRMHL